MKNTFKITFLFGATLILVYCHGVCVEPDGKCSNPPHISTTTLNFDASGGVGTIILDSLWYIGGMYADSWEFHDMLVCFTDTTKDVADISVCHLVYLVDVDTLLFESTRQPGGRTVGRWESEWFSITSKNNESSYRQLVFEVKPNDTGKDRKLLIDLSDRNCFASLAISQSAE